MKEFLKALSFVAILQIVTWILTILFDQLMDWMRILIVLLIIGLILYYKIDRKVVLNSQMSTKKFNISLFILWFISLFVDIIWLYFSHDLLEMFPNHTCSFMFCGIEYIMLWFGRCIQFAMAGLYKIIRYIYEKYKKNKKNKN